MAPPSDFALTICLAGAGDRNLRAMTGARLLGEALAVRVGVTPRLIGRATDPVGGSWQQELAAAQRNLQSLAQLLEGVFRDGRTPISTLSRCAVALATLPVVAKHRPDACIVWFDAHGDINTPETTKSGYLGGMVITGAAGRWNSGLGGTLSLSNVVLVGARDLDPAERALIEGGAPMLVTAGPDLPKRLHAVVADRPVYVHLDCDVLDPGLVPTEYRVPGGLAFDDLHAACRVLARNEVVGLEVAELEATSDKPAGPIPALIDALAPLITAITRA
jgi:arginase